MEAHESKSSEKRIFQTKLSNESLETPQHNTPSSIYENLSCKSSTICRICHMSEPRDELLMPCNCIGTLGYVHKSCLENWLSRSGLTQCELCLYVYKTRNTLRYSLMQSLRIYYRHPNHCGLLQADILGCCLITLLTVSKMSKIKFKDTFLLNCNIGNACINLYH